MKILILNYEFPPIGGGAASASFHLAKRYVAMDHDVHVLTSRVLDQPSRETIDGVIVNRVASWRRGPHNTGLLGAATYLWNARRCMSRLLVEEHFDIAQFFFAVPTGLLSFVWQRRTGKPYVVSLRGSDVPGYDRNFKLVGFLHRCLRPVTRRLLASSSDVVANSQSLAALANESFPDVPIDVITNAVAEDLYFPDRDDATHGLTVICVMRLVKRKGIDLLLRAFGQVQPIDLQLKIVGVGPEMSALQTLATELGVSGQVTFCGQLSGEELAEEYRRADFLAHPAQVESFSMTLLEAMSSGLPIVASGVGGIPELVEDRVNGILVEPANIDELANAIVEMAENTAMRQRMSAANRSKIVQQFTWSNIADQYIHRFKRAVSDASDVADARR